MKKARVNLKYFRHTVDLLAHEVALLDGKGATRSENAKIRALHKKLTRVQKLMVGTCIPGMFRTFDSTELPMGSRG